MESHCWWQIAYKLTVTSVTPFLLHTVLYCAPSPYPFTPLTIASPSLLAIRIMPPAAPLTVYFHYFFLLGPVLFLDAVSISTILSLAVPKLWESSYWPCGLHIYSVLYGLASPYWVVCWEGATVATNLHLPVRHRQWVRLHQQGQHQSQDKQIIQYPNRQMTNPSNRPMWLWQGMKHIGAVCVFIIDLYDACVVMLWIRLHPRLVLLQDHRLQLPTVTIMVHNTWSRGWLSYVV